MKPSFRAVLVLALVILGAAFVLVVKMAPEAQIRPEVRVPPEKGVGSTKGVGTTEEPAPVYLSDLRWESASTGWVALADDNLPKLGTSFLNTPISIGGASYDNGLGTFPLSEITYRLASRYSSFRALVGLDDLVPVEKGSVVFKLFLDDVLVYDSGIVRSGDRPVPLEASLVGVDTLKLVVEDAGDGSSLDYADWADAVLTPVADFQAMSLRPDLQGQREQRKRLQSEEWEVVRERSAREKETVSSVLATAELPTEALAAFVPDRNLIVLANDKLAVTLGFGGERNGLLNITSLDPASIVAMDTSPSVVVDGPGRVTLSRDTRPMDGDAFRSERIDDPALGSGTKIEADFVAPGAGVVITTRICLFDGNSYLTYQLEVRGVDEDRPLRGFDFFSMEAPGAFVVGEEAGYITDYSLIRRAEVRDDSILRSELVGLGKPVLIYDRSRGQRIVMAILDEVSAPARFSVQLDDGHVAGRLGLGLPLEDARSAGLQISPRLFFQPSDRSALRDVTYSYRNAVASLYPPPTIPDWVKYQWGTWYAFGMNYDEATIRNQIDYIAQNLSDLGPWSILLDAGWYVAEGKPGSTWKVDEEKFPDGLRPVVDYAHSRGIKVVLYYSAPYLDDREREGNWLGLRGFIEEHPDWVIKLQSDSSGSSYVYNFGNPELEEYMRELVASFFRDYDVDGIKIDGLGQAEGEQLSQEERDTFGDVNKIRMFTMDVYRLIYQEAAKAGKDVYVESGWAIPAYANAYAHSFRYADEFPAIEHRYPAPGLLEHIDYAAHQKRLLGQRPNMGMVWGGSESQEMIRLWFEAALAMGTQMTISSDLTRLAPRDLSSLRAVLAHYNAFQGETYFVGIPDPSSFATSVDGTIYLGAVNRNEGTRRSMLRLSDYGLSPTSDYLLYDVSNGSYSNVKGSFQASIPGPGFKLYLLRNSPGVTWTNSSIEVEQGEDSLMLTARGPRGIGGIAEIYAPHMSSVWLDGKELPRTGSPRAGESYSYDSSTGVLRLRYRHDRPHSIEIRF